MRPYFTCGPQETRSRISAPLEYDEPDPAPDFDDDECDDDEYGPPASLNFPGAGLIGL